MPNQLFNYRFDDVKGNSFCYTYTSFSDEDIGEMQVRLIGDISSKMETIKECKSFVQMLGMEFSENHGKNEYSFSIKTKSGDNQHDRILLIAKRFLEQEKVILENKNGEKLSKNFENALVVAKLIEPPIEFLAKTVKVEILGVVFAKHGISHDPTFNVTDHLDIKVPAASQTNFLKKLRRMAFGSRSKLPA